MTKDHLIEQHHETFEDIRHLDEEGNEYWLARELAPVLEYVQWRNFVGVISRSKISCEKAGYQVSDHFADISKMINIGKNAERKVEDIVLSRYACYLIVQNGDPSKAIIAQGQAYFAIQTRRQELADEEMAAMLSEDEKRLHLRGEISSHNKDLSSLAKDSGVTRFGIFQDEGYKGLYGGLGSKDIHRKKNLKASQQILDHMGSTELAANFFRVTQTLDKLRRENIRSEAAASQTHREVGRKVRQTIKELGGTMPENLPTPEKSIQQLKTAKKKQIK